MRKQSMKKNSGRSFAASLIILTVTILMYGCSDMITSLIATIDARVDAAPLSTDDITFASGDTADAVTANFTLPVAGEVNATTTITWSSGNTGVISISGGTATVIRPTDADTEVILTATLTVEEGNTETKTITVTVKKLYGGVVTTLAGTGASGSADGTGTSASFNYPYGVCTDGTDLYVGDSTNHLIRKGELSD